MAVSVLNVYHGTTDPNLTDLVCHALDCLTDPLNFYDLTDEQKVGFSEDFQKKIAIF